MNEEHAIKLSASQLDRAEELLESGYFKAAKFLAGGVKEYLEALKSQKVEEHKQQLLARVNAILEKCEAV